MSRFRTVMLYTVFGVIIMMLASAKKDMHEDEFWSYFLANGHGTGGLLFEDGIWYEDPVSLWTESMSADEMSILGFRDVWMNQADDVHPPLYYAILHTACMLIPGEWSMWQAGLVNLIFGLLCLRAWRKLVLEFGAAGCERDVLSVLFICTYGILQCASYFRMYMMAMWVVTEIACLSVKTVKSGTLDRKDLLRWLFASVCGALTHYYCILYLMLSYGTVCIYLLKNRERNTFARLSACMAAAGVLSVTIFPDMLGHVLFGYVGVWSRENLTDAGFAERVHRLLGFFVIVCGQLGGWAACVVTGMATALHERKKHTGSCAARKVAAVVLIPVTVYFAIVAMSAPYVVDRYMFPIYGIISAMCASVAAYVYRTWQKDRDFKEIHVLTACIVTTVFGISCLAGGWEYLYRDTDAVTDWAKEQDGLPCVCVYKPEKKWHVQRSYFEMSNYERVAFFSCYDLEDMLTISEDLEDGFVLMVTDGRGTLENGLEMVLDLLPEMKKEGSPNENRFSVSYRIVPK